MEPHKCDILILLSMFLGCLVDKPWDWDEVQINQLKARQNIKKMLVGHGLNVVQNMAAGYYDASSS